MALFHSRAVVLDDNLNQLSISRIDANRLEAYGIIYQFEAEDGCASMFHVSEGYELEELEDFWSCCLSLAEF